MKQPTTPTLGNKKKMKLTKDIDCEWCGALAGEPCKIQIPVEEQKHTHQNGFHYGNDKIYFKEEVVHLCRAK